MTKDAFLTNRTSYLLIDLTGSKLGDEWESVTATGTWPGTDKEIVAMAATHYGVPVEQVQVRETPLSECKRSHTLTEEDWYA